MPAPFQIIPATPDETIDILGLEQFCYSRPWNERLVRTFLVAACLPNKGYLAKVMKEDDTVVAYAFASRHNGQLVVERLGVKPEKRRKGIASGLMVSLIFAAREMMLPAIVCFVGEENLAGQEFLTCDGFKALPITDEARTKRVIQFARSVSSQLT